MTKPTLESLNEAARLTGFKDWPHVQANESPQWPAVNAHAITLDKLQAQMSLMRKGESK